MNWKSWLINALEGGFVMNWKPWLVYGLGGWLICVAFMKISGTTQGIDDLVVGVLAVILGIILAQDKLWHGRVVGLLGVWLIIAALIPPLHDGRALYWNNILVGFVIAGAGLLAFPVREDEETPWQSPL